MEIAEEEVEISTDYFSIDLYGSRGINGIQNVIFINYLAEACGVDGGGLYLFAKNKTLNKVFEVTEIVDGGIYWLNEKLIFPNDENGVTGKIVFQREIGNYVEEETNWVEVNKVSRELEWKNGEILPKIKN